MPNTVRAGRPEDLPRLTEIYNHYVLTSPATFDLEPFTSEQRSDWFAQHPELGPHRLLVAERDGRVSGYVTSSPWRPKPAYATTVETTVYLDPAELGRGIGTELYLALFEVLAGESVHRAVAGVVPPNPGSFALHERLGFAPVGTFTEVGHKFGRFWDVTWLARPMKAL